MKAGFQVALLAMALVFTMANVASATLTVIGQGTITAAGGNDGGVGQTVDLVYSSLLNVTILNFSNAGDTWYNHMDWASDLVVDIDLNGDMVTDIEDVQGWRLPLTFEEKMDLNGPWGTDVGTGHGMGWGGLKAGESVYDYRSGYNMDLSSEMARLFYDELGNKGYLDLNGNVQSGYGLINKGPLTALSSSSDNYFSGTVWTPDPSVVSYEWDAAWDFFFNLGAQGMNIMDCDAVFALAVLDGNPVPVPAAVWLLGTGLLALIGLRRKIKN